MTTSLDGYATGPDISVEDAMGVGGEALHEWIFGDDPVDQRVAKSSVSRHRRVHRRPHDA